MYQLKRLKKREEREREREKKKRTLKRWPGLIAFTISETRRHEIAIGSSSSRQPVIIAKGENVVPSTIVVDLVSVDEIRSEKSGT